jgi:hypothetical protein
MLWEVKQCMNQPAGLRGKKSLSYSLTCCIIHKLIPPLHNICCFFSNVTGHNTCQRAHKIPNRVATGASVKETHSGAAHRLQVVAVIVRLARLSSSRYAQSR